MTNNRSNWLFYVASATGVFTFLLILVGGTVNPTGSSLACPEPFIICQGSLFPAMTGGVLYEHGHRLFAMMVGLFQIVLTILLWKNGRKALGIIGLVMVLFQGLLGAVTVAYRLPTIVSSSHLLVAVLYFSLTLSIIYRYKKIDQSAINLKADSRKIADASKIMSYTMIAMVLIFFQIGLGGWLRHSGGALACLDIPFCGGSLWPSGFLMRLHMAHRILGVIVGTWLFVWSFTLYKTWLPSKSMFSWFVPLLVLGQILLGFLSVYWMRPVPVVVAHLGIAVLLWASVFWMWMTLKKMSISSC